MVELRDLVASAAGPLSADGPDTASCRYRFAAGFAGFDGHFPGDPVLPAVIQLLAALLLAERVEGRRLRLAAVPSAKFLRPVRPGEEIVVTCRVRSEGGERLHDATVTAEGQTAASILLRLLGDREPG